jgi:hypothetical protein
MMTSVAGYGIWTPGNDNGYTNKETKRERVKNHFGLFIHDATCTLRTKSSTCSTAGQRTKSPLPLHHAQPKTPYLT